MSQRFGLFGGTFDPVHNAHVALARSALQALDLDEVRWVPTGQAWQKTRAITAALHREAMVRLAIADEPRFVLDRIELERDGPSYTLDTVRALQAAHPGVSWFLLIGADQYANLHSWHGWQELLTRVVLAVAARPGVAGLPQAEVLAHQEVLARAHRVLPLPPMDLSATELRSRITLGQPITHLVPPAVASYIDQQALYRGAFRS